MSRQQKTVLLNTVMIILLLAPLATAHVEHAEPAVSAESPWYKLFLLHDWIHPILFLLLIYTCYYLRFFSSRHIRHQPRDCFQTCSSCYKGEGTIKRWHRYIFWLTLLFLFIHLGEIIPSIRVYATLTGLDTWILISESGYVFTAFLYLGTCYHFRYAIERLAKKRIVSYKVYNGITNLNRHHHFFFWIMIFFVSIRFILVALMTQSLIKAIPGTF